jgi:hypothetical protein
LDGEEAVKDLKLIDAICLAVKTGRLPVGGGDKVFGYFVHSCETRDSRKKIRIVINLLNN